MMEGVNIWSDKVVERSVATWSRANNPWTKMAFKLASTGDLHIDLGCGFGRFLKYLLEHKKTPFKYIGVDGSRSMIEKCTSTFLGLSVEDATFFVHDITQGLDFLKSSECVILCNSVLIHLPRWDQDAVIKNVSEVGPQVFVTEIQTKEGYIGERVGEEMGEKFYRTYNDLKAFESRISKLFPGYLVLRFPFAFAKVTRHVFSISRL